jgi:hypothetical protein
MMTPTKARQAIVALAARWGMTPAMCKGKSSDLLLGIVSMTVQHRNYLGVLEPDELVKLGELESLVAELRNVN